MMTISQIKKVCDVACDRYGINFYLDININTRFTRTLGRVTYNIDANNRCKPTKFELSKQLLETSTDGQILDVVLHECAHFIAIELTGEPHHHDAYFKKICHTIGTSNDAPSTDDVNIKYRYDIFCKDCNKRIGGYSRMCATLRRLDECYCKNCKKSNLYYIQNW